MPTRRGARRKRDARPRSRGRREAGRTVAVWEDDPGAPDGPPSAPVIVAEPTPGARPLPFRITGRAPAPDVYPPGAPGFRFYAAAAALRRTADFWGRVAGAALSWQVGLVLPVHLDEGVDLNAFYTRGGFGSEPGLHFFHERVASRTYFSGESPDILSHEMGHAVLDAIRPQLFDAQSIEAAAFHEAFGDMSAILSALQVPSFRDAVLRDTQGALNRSSRLSRLAEQLGFAIRVRHPDAVDPDCLRNAANSFFYRDPQTLPPSAPASQLSSEPHSFSRVFTAAFLDALAAVFRAKGSPASSDALLRTTEDVAQLLVAAAREAPIVPDYFSQVAAHMIDAGERPPVSGAYRAALKGAFVRRGILSLSGALAVTARPRGRRRAAPAPAPAARPLPRAAIAGAQYGLQDLVLTVFTAEDPKRFAVTSSSSQLGPVEPRSAQHAAEAFTEDLFQRGHVDLGPYARADDGAAHPLSMKTHVVVREGDSLVLRRRLFDCGFHA